jgi:serine/threonine-protein kinase RsbW
MNVPDPTLNENVDRPSGRGLLLMRHHMTTVQFSCNGNCVSMTKLRRA